MARPKTVAPDRLSGEEALAALETIRQVELHTRRAIGLGGGGAIMIVWGLVWMAGFGGGHWLSGASRGLLWLVVDLLGLAGTAWVLTRVRGRIRIAGGRRIGGFWLALFLFTGLVVWIALPLDGNQVGLLISVLMMFGYVVMGLFVDRVFLGVGLTVTVLAVAGYLALPETFNLWMAVLGGGTLVASGLYVRRRWR